MAKEIDRLKILYQEFDRLKDAGDDVVADIKKEMTNLELAYLKDNVFPEVAKFMASKVKNLRCGIDSSFQYDGDNNINYSFGTSESMVFVKDNIELNQLDNTYLYNYHENETHPAIIPISSSTTQKRVNVSKPVQFKNYSFKENPYKEFEKYLATIKNKNGRTMSSSSISVYSCSLRNRYMIGKILQYVADPNLELISDESIISKIYEEVSNDYERGIIKNASFNALKKYLDYRRIVPQGILNIENLKVNEHKRASFQRVTQFAQNIFKVRKSYSINGRGAYNKRQTVLEVVRKYMKLNPFSNYKEIEKDFPKELQGCYGVITQISTISDRISRGHDDNRRYLLNQENLFKSADGVEFAVCGEWGNQFDNFRRYIEDHLGWKIEEV